MDLITLAQLAFDWGMTPVPIKMAGKHPYLPGWQNTAKEDAMRRVIREVKKKNGADGISILTGAPSGVVVVDVDDVSYFTQLVGDQSIDPTLVIQTPSGGLHYYFRYEPRVAHLRNSNRIYGHKIDFRTNGGVIIFPGNPGYEVVYPRDINERSEPPLSLMPDWLLSWISNYQASVGKH